MHRLQSKVFQGGIKNLCAISVPSLAPVWTVPYLCPTKPVSPLSSLPRRLYFFQCECDPDLILHHKTLQLAQSPCPFDIHKDECFMRLRWRSSVLFSPSPTFSCTNVSDGPQEKGICTLQQGDKTVNISILNLINMLLLYAAFKVLESRNSDGSCGLTTLWHKVHS